MSRETLKPLWDQAKAKGWTFTQLAERTVHWKKTAVREMIMECKGDDLLEETIRAKLKEILEKTDSVIAGRQESATSGVARLVDKPDDLTLEQWRQRAVFYEERLKQLQANLQSAISLSEVPLPEVSSTPRSAAANYARKASASAKSDPSE